MAILKAIGNFFLSIVLFVINSFRSTFGAGIFLITAASLVQSIVVPTHVSAMVQNSVSISAMYVFLIVGASMVNLFNIANYNGKQSIGTISVIWIATIVVTVSTVLYLQVVLNSSSFGLTKQVRTSTIIMIVTGIMSLAGTISLTIHQFFGTPVER